MEQTDLDAELAEIDAGLLAKLEVRKTRLAELDAEREKLDASHGQALEKLAQQLDFPGKKANKEHNDKRKQLTAELQAERKAINVLKRRLDIVEHRTPKPEEAQA